MSTVFPAVHLSFQVVIGLTNLIADLIVAPINIYIILGVAVSNLKSGFQDTMRLRSVYSGIEPERSD